MEKICPICCITYDGRRSQKTCSISCGLRSRQKPDRPLLSLPSREGAYTLGFFFADGCISSDTSLVGYRITLSNTDLALMKTLHSMMTPNKKLYEYKHIRYPKAKLSYSIVSHAEEDISFLLGHGIDGPKSLELPWPDFLPPRLMPDFIRGFLDGDGSVCIYNHNQSGHKYRHVRFTSGAEGFIHRLYEFLSRDVGLSLRPPRYDERVSGSSWSLTVARQREVLRLREYLYSGPSRLYMQRKHDKFYEDIVRTA